MATNTVSTPYSTIVPYLPTSAAAWIPADEQERILSYQAYEDIFWNNPNAFKLVQRGTNDSPIYIPSGRVIVETINRYVAKDFDLRLVPGLGSDTEQQAATQALTALFNRERFFSKFAANKRYGIIRGDWLFHITANPDKAEGSRISITSLDPSTYFAITDPDNVDSVIGCDIAESVVVADKSYVKRHRYMKTDTGITSEILIVEEEGWNTDSPKVLQQVMPIVTLPADITALPVYHIKNFEEPQNPYGSSELRGLERIIAAVNQGISDEELTLAMEGLGVYATDAGAPVDDNGNDMPWRLGPGRVLELPEGTKFNRVNGVNTVGPFQDHLKYLHDRLDEGSAASNVAKGSVEVATAESGIALALRFAPLIDLATEKDLLVKDVMRQFGYDLRAWFKVYESLNLDNILWDAYCGPKLPVDRAAEADRWQSLADSGYISIGTLYTKLRELGYDIPEGELANIASEQDQLAAAGVGPGADNTSQVGADLAAEAAGATPASGA